VKELLRADPGAAAARDARGRTPLMVMLQEPPQPFHPLMVKLLLRADPKAPRGAVKRCVARDGGTLVPDIVACDPGAAWDPQDPPIAAAAAALASPTAAEGRQRVVAAALRALCRAEQVAGLRAKDGDYAVHMVLRAGLVDHPMFEVGHPDGVLATLLRQSPEAAAKPGALGMFPAFLAIAHSRVPACVIRALRMLQKCHPGLYADRARGDLLLHAALRQNALPQTVLEVFAGYPKAVEERASDGRTALDLAFSFIHDSTVVLKILRQYPGAAAVPSPDNVHALHRAVLLRYPVSVVAALVDAWPQACTLPIKEDVSLLSFVTTSAHEPRLAAVVQRGLNAVKQQRDNC